MAHAREGSVVVFPPAHNPGRNRYLPRGQGYGHYVFSPTLIVPVYSAPAHPQSRQVKPALADGAIALVKVGAP